jgi:hypothetical protein
MAERDIIPFSSEEGRQILQGRVGPVAQPRAQGDIVPFNAPEAQQFLPAQARGRNYEWGEIPLAAARNAPGSAANFYGDIVQAVTSPIDTLRSTFQLAGGAAISALPQGAQNWLMSVANDPAKVQESINMARNVGGFYADRYGTGEGFRRALAEDPVGVAADFSTILSGGASATARVAPRASAALQTASNVTNPLTPLAVAGSIPVPLTGRNLAENVTGVGNVVLDAVAGRSGERIARNIITQALGEQNIPTIAQLSDPRFRNMGAGEAALAAGVNRPQFQALARDVAQADRNNVFFQQEQARPIARQQQLAAVTPDLEQATAARSGTTGPLYEAARSQPVLVTENLRNTIDGLPPSIIRTARRLAKEDPRGPGDIDFDRMVLDGRALNYIRTAITDELGKPPSGRTAGTAERGFLTQRLQELTREFEAQVPEFQQARTTFAEMSAPVNQATILNEMQRRLTGPMEQERPGQFMRVLGEGEEALLRTSTGAPRFQEGDLMRILTEEQGRAVTNVADQLRRERTMDVQARRGAAGLADILEENRPLGFRIPNVLNRTVMVANRTLNLLEGKVSNQTRAALEQAMLSGENLNQFLNGLPNDTRGIVSQAIRDAGSMVDRGGLRNVGVLQGAIEEGEQGPFRAELRGMAR